MYVVYVVCGSLVAAVAWFRLVSAPRSRHRRAGARGSGLRAGIGALLNVPDAGVPGDRDGTIVAVYELLGIADATWRRRDLPLSRPGAVVVRDWAFDLGESIGGIAGIDGEPRVEVIDPAAGSRGPVTLRVRLQLRVARRERFGRSTWFESDTRWELAGGADGWRPVAIEPYVQGGSTERAID